MRSRGRRHLHPPVLGGGLRGTTGVHRPRDPAHQPRLGDPVDGGSRPRSRRRLPLRRAAGPQGGPRRHDPAHRAGGVDGRRRRTPAPDRGGPRHGRAPPRPPTGPDGGGGPPQRGAGRRARGGRRPDGAGRPRAARGGAGQGRPVPSSLHRQDVRFPGLPQPVALPHRTAPRALRQRVPQDVQGGVPALAAHPRVAGPQRPAAEHVPRTRLAPALRPGLRGRPAQGDPHRPAHQCRHARRGRPRVPGHPRHPLPDLSRLGPGP